MVIAFFLVVIIKTLILYFMLVQSISSVDLVEIPSSRSYLVNVPGQYDNSHDWCNIY